MKNRTKTLVMLALGLALVPPGFALTTTPASAATSGSDVVSPHRGPAAKSTDSLSKNAKSSKETSAEQEEAVRSVLMSLESAIGAKSIDTTMELFADEAIFIDEGGNEIRGRSALRERFEQIFKASAASSVGIHPQRITFPADNVALVVGEVSRKRDDEDLPATKFSMVLVKNKKAWTISEVTEIALPPEQTGNHLEALNWLIGNWSATTPGAHAKLDVQWVSGKKFITLKCILEIPEQEAKVDTQVIGWDPQRQRIVSWQFDANGGFANAVWTAQKSENKWTVDTTGVDAAGGNTIASNIYTLKSPEEFVWQSVHRSVDGAAVDDSQPITVRKVKP